MGCAWQKPFLSPGVTLKQAKGQRRAWGLACSALLLTVCLFPFDCQWSARRGFLPGDQPKPASKESIAEMQQKQKFHGLLCRGGGEWIEKGVVWGDLMPRFSFASHFLQWASQGDLH